MYDHTFRFGELPALQPDTMSRFVKHRYRKHWHKYVAQLVMIERARPRDPLPHVEIRCMRHSSREPDRDNLWYSFKPVVDGFKRAGVILDDTPKVIVLQVAEWSHAPQGEGHVTVHIATPADVGEYNPD